jgi:hypothetical protein
MSLQVPRIKLLDSSRAVVHRWGQVRHQIMRSGDRLILGQEREGALLLLVPKGHGFPMLGIRRGQQLIAEPGGVPASSRRWHVMGAVVAIERDHERSVMDSGKWFVSTRLEGCSDDPTDPSLARARQDFRGGWCTASEVDAMTLRAALAPESCGIQVACAVGSSPEQAMELLAQTAAGSIRISTEGGVGMTRTTVIPGPWPQEEPARLGTRVEAGALDERGVQLGLFGDSPLMYAC